MKKTGFTLAEVLITLTIIGVIAALTIPNLSRKWSDQADVQKVKEAYSLLSNAIQISIRENGSLIDTQPSTTDLQNIIAQNLKIKEQMIDGKNCDYGWASSGTKQTNPKGNCGYMKTFSGYFKSDPGAYNASKAFILQNGMIFKVANFSNQVGHISNVNIYRLWVDINGKKAPNQSGYDIFWFYLYRDNDKFRPASAFSGAASWANCDKTSTSAASGMSCTDWVIKKGNMDYKY